MVTLSSLLLQYAAGFSVPHLTASFQDTPQPFKIDVDPAFIDDLRSRVANARAPVPVAGSEDDGVPFTNFTNVEDYWVNQYNWNDTQASINSE